jgi:hypothetical protein
MKRVLITGVAEDSVHRDHRIGCVTEGELQELRYLACSTLEDRLEKLAACPVLRLVYHYVEDDDTSEWYEFRDSYTDRFTRVDPIDVANESCYQIIWELH